MGEGAALLYRRISVNKYRMKEIQNHHQASTTAITVVGKTHQRWILKLVGKKFEENQNICRVSKKNSSSIMPKILTNYKGKESSNFTVESDKTQQTGASPSDQG